MNEKTPIRYIVWYNVTKEGTTDNSFHYCGEQRDTTTGLYYLRARYMNPQTASFTQKDSYAGDMYSPETQNGYLYTGGNPVMYADPGGNSYSLAETLTSFGISEALSDVIVTSTYYMILAGELGAAITITREAYNAGAIERVKNKLISIYEEDPYIPIFVAEDGVREIIIDTIPEKEPFKETMPEYEGERQDIVLDPGLVQKSFWNTIMWNEGGRKTLLESAPDEIVNMTRKELQDSLPEGWDFQNHNGRIHIKDENGNYRVKIIAIWQLHELLELKECGRILSWNNRVTGCVDLILKEWGRCL